MMKRAAIVVGLLSSMGCGKQAAEATPEVAPPVPVEVQAEPPKAEDAAPAPAEVKAAEEVAAEVAAEAPGAAAAQCTRILEKSWKAIQPALTKLQVLVAADAEAEFMTSGYDAKAFNEKCPSAPKGYRDCIEAGDNPLHFIRACHRQLAEPKPDELPIPKAPIKSALLDAATLPAEAGAKILASIVGTWESTDNWGTETWVIAKDGKVEITRTRDGKPQEKSSLDSFSVSFAKVGEMVVHYSGNDQRRSFFLAEDGKTLYTSGNLMWAVYPLRDSKTFVAMNDFDWVIATDGACEVVTYLGSVLPATCAFAERDGAKFFDLTYQVPGAMRWGTTEPEPTQTSFPVFGTNLLAPNLVKNEAYSRK